MISPVADGKAPERSRARAEDLGLEAADPPPTQSWQPLTDRGLREIGETRRPLAARLAASASRRRPHRAIAFRAGPDASYQRIGRASVRARRRRHPPTGSDERFLGKRA